MSELLADRAPHRLIAVTAVATLALGSVLVARARHPAEPPHHHRHLPSLAHCVQAPRPASHALPAPLDGNRVAVDLDGDGVPEVVDMTFRDTGGGTLITQLYVEKLRGSQLVPTAGAAMRLSDPIDPAPCIGAAAVWPAGSPGGGRIELTQFARVPSPYGGAATCEASERHTYRLRGGVVVATDPPFIDQIDW